VLRDSPLVCGDELGPGVLGNPCRAASAGTSRTTWVSPFGSVARHPISPGRLCRTPRPGAGSPIKRLRS